MADQNTPLNMDPKAKKFQIKMDDQTAQGVYSNFAMIYHSENEFVVDFCYTQPGPPPPRASVRSRIILSPKHVKRLVSALEGNIQKHEDRFGPISPAKDETHVFH